MTLAEPFGVRDAIVRAPMANVQSTSLAAAGYGLYLGGTGAPRAPRALGVTLQARRSSLLERLGAPSGRHT